MQNGNDASFFEFMMGNHVGGRNIVCPAADHADVLCIHGRLMQGTLLWGHCPACVKVTAGLPR